MGRARRRAGRRVLIAGTASLSVGLAGCGGNTAAPRPAPTASAHPAGGQVTLHFRARAAGRAAGEKLAFFGEYRAAPAGRAGAAPSMPPPGPGNGYVSLRLTGGDDGVYTASQHLDPGRYMVGIFVGHGVRHAGSGEYPAAPVRLISASGGEGSGVSVELTRDRTVRGLYRDTGRSRSSSAAPPSSAAPTPTTGTG